MDIKMLITAQWNVSVKCEPVAVSEHRAFGTRSGPGLQSNGWSLSTGWRPGLPPKKSSSTDDKKESPHFVHVLKTFKRITQKISKSPPKFPKSVTGIAKIAKKTFRQHFLKAALKNIAQINSSIALACWISLTIQLDMSNGAFWYLKGETRRLRVRVSSGTC